MKIVWGPQKLKPFCWPTHTFRCFRKQNCADFQRRNQPWHVGCCPLFPWHCEPECKRHLLLSRLFQCCRDTVRSWGWRLIISTDRVDSHWSQHFSHSCRLKTKAWPPGRPRQPWLRTVHGDQPELTESWLGDGRHSDARRTKQHHGGDSWQRQRRRQAPG